MVTVPTIVRYDPINGDACPDGHAMQTARRLKGTTDYVTANSTVIDALRVLRATGVVGNLAFRFCNDEKDWLINCDARGSLDVWPEGFCDHTENFLITLAREKGKR